MAEIAVVIDQDYEDVELEQPLQCLKEAGHRLTLVGTEKGKQVEGKRHESKVTVECTPADVDAARFDALLIPGGYSPDHLRMNEDIVDFVRAFRDGDKLIAAICHGPSLLIDADAVAGRRLTSWPSVRRDLENAGGKVVDEQVVVDGNLITSRKPDDLPAFCEAILEHPAIA
ncbi:MAG TPA: type 1 glutamine amidotransferase domain-containing protein [Pseudomonadales bacterium]